MIGLKDVWFMRWRVFTPKKTWKQLVKSDLKRMNLSMSDALNYNKCRNLLRGG